LNVESDQFQQITYQVNDGVALITLNRPDRHNAWSGAMSVEYRWALHHAHIDAAVRVVVLTGAGDSFCVGADRSELQEIGAANGQYTKARASLPPYPEDSLPAFRHNQSAPLTISKPLIAAVNGACAGAGFVIATYADLRWVSDQAKVATSFAGLGLPAEYGIGWVLSRLVGPARALELLYDPEPRSAGQLQELGFAQRVVVHEELLSAVMTYAERLARHSAPDSLRTMKRAVLFDAAGDFDSAYRSSVAEMNAALAGPAFQVGVQAKQAGERPDFLASDLLQAAPETT
jgi:enoyl-CoA hydratase/carnithine racemase